VVAAIAAAVLMQVLGLVHPAHAESLTEKRNLALGRVLAARNEAARQAAMPALPYFAAAGSMRMPADPAMRGSEICLNEIAVAERRYSVPPKLLQAIAIGESGRWVPEQKRSYPWPWTVTNGGDGEYLPNKQAAIAHVRQLQARGETNIDVGCMQINLRAHPDAFASLEEAFDPRTNVGYAINLLNSLKQREGNWVSAVGFYHSATPSLKAKYSAKIASIWQGLKGAADLQQTLYASAGGNQARPSQSMTGLLAGAAADDMTMAPSAGSLGVAATQLAAFPDATPDATDEATGPVLPRQPSAFFTSLVNRAPGQQVVAQQGSLHQGGATGVTAPNTTGTVQPEHRGKGLGDYMAQAMPAVTTMSPSPHINLR
jgi:ribosomal protein S16